MSKTKMNISHLPELTNQRKIIKNFERNINSVKVKRYFFSDIVNLYQVKIMFYFILVYYKVLFIHLIS